MQVLIFGGAGFIGRPLARALLSQGHNVTIGDNLSVKPAELPAEIQSRLVRVNVTSAIQLYKILAWEPEVIFWLCAKQGYQRDWSRYARTNVQAVYSLFEAIARLRPWRPQAIVLASSQAIYAPGLQVTEEHEKKPFSVYGWTKLQEEQAFDFFVRDLFDIRLVSLRYSIVLGGGQSLQDSESGVLRNWHREVGHREVEQHRGPQIYGDGRQVRDFVHLKDVTAANLLAMGSNASGPINIGGIPISVGELAYIFHNEAGGPEPIITGHGHRPGGEFCLTSSIDRARRLLGWEPALPIEAMVHDFLKSAKGVDEKPSGPQSMFP